MLLLNVFKTIYDFISNGKIIHGVVAALLVAVGYLIYHFFGMVLACVIVGFSAIIYLLLRMPSVIAANAEKKHFKNDRYRRYVNDIVRRELLECLRTMGASRVFVTEGHNGTSSASNLSFLYMDITYLETAVLNDWITFDYRNISTSLFPCFDWIAQHITFEGTIEDLSSLDNKIARIVNSNGTNYLVATGLFDAHNNCIGTVVATYPEKPEDTNWLQANLQRTANKLERLLTKQYSLKELEAMLENK